ncbi:MAG: hypothetical protein ABI726_10205 [bacterium]
MAALAATVVLAGCGADDESGGGGAEAEGVGIVRAGSTAQFANCRDWRGGTKVERYATIEDIRGQLTPQGSETAESDLTDEAAYELFEHSCEAGWADKFRLYKLYARAQAFAPLTSGP